MRLTDLNAAVASAENRLATALTKVKRIGGLPKNDHRPSDNHEILTTLHRHLGEAGGDAEIELDFLNQQARHLLERMYCLGPWSPLGREHREITAPILSADKKSLKRTLIQMETIRQDIATYSSSYNRDIHDNCDRHIRLKSSKFRQFQSLEDFHERKSLNPARLSLEGEFNDTGVFNDVCVPFEYDFAYPKHIFSTASVNLAEGCLQHADHLAERLPRTAMRGAFLESILILFPHNIDLQKEITKTGRMIDDTAGAVGFLLDAARRHQFESTIPFGGKTHYISAVRDLGKRE